MVTSVINNVCVYFFLGESGNGEMSKILLAPILRTKSRKRMFFFNAFRLWKNISDNGFVYSTDLKKFRRKHFDCIIYG